MKSPIQQALTTIKSYSYLTKEFFIIVIMIVTGSFVFQITEWRSRFESLYFTVITMTSVGFGDLVPSSVAGKIFTMIYAILGVPMFIYTTSIVLQMRFRGYLKRVQQHESLQPEPEPHNVIEKFLFQLYTNHDEKEKKKSDTN